MSNLFVTSLASFPNLGTKDYFITDKPELLSIKNYEEHNIASRSSLVLDDFTNPHPRFSAMMQNIRERRGKKVDITVPLYPDENTKDGKIDSEISPGYIYMDSQHFGMGCCCLQVTFEAQNVEHAKYIHDSFIPLNPIFAALSASAPVYKGQLSNWDLRWNIISQSVDCRTENEKDPSNEKYIPKSRYSSMNHYISDHHNFIDDHLNDGIKLPVNNDYMDQLKEAGISDRLSYHFASLFAHDSIVIHSGYTDYDENETFHFENLNSTNWNSVRFKPPPSLQSDIGWRVEFRSLDIQITDYENAAFIALLNLMTKVLNDFEIDVSLPISLTDINMERAHDVDAVIKQKFWFRKDIVDLESDYTKNKAKDNCWSPNKEYQPKPFSKDDLVEMSVLDILVGNKIIGNTGLITLFEEYMKINEYEEDIKEYYTTMLNFLVDRASGKVKTGARFIRDIVLNHPDYENDSVVTDQISFDIVKEATILGMSAKWDESLLGKMPDFMKEYSNTQ